MPDYLVDVIKVKKVVSNLRITASTDKEAGEIAIEQYDHYALDQNEGVRYDAIAIAIEEG